MNVDEQNEILSTVQETNKGQFIIHKMQTSTCIAVFVVLIYVVYNLVLLHQLVT